MRKTRWGASFAILGTLAGASPAAHGQAEAPAVHVVIPARPRSVRFAVIGDSGTGALEQYQVGKMMASYHDAFPFDFVLMMGDNIYGPKDYRKKFEEPYEDLLRAGAKFLACLGNHDHKSEVDYALFNMHGNRYYRFSFGDIDFFALDSSHMDVGQLKWIDTQLDGSKALWKICFFHHPYYSHSRFHEEDVNLRRELEPLFVKHGVNVVLTGHQHVYERIKPQLGIYYFVLGNSGQLRYHDLKESAETAKGYDTDRTFMLGEIAGDEFYLQTISRVGETVDSGTLPRQQSANSGSR